MPDRDAPPLERRLHVAMHYHGAPGCSDPDFFETALRARVLQWDAFAAYSPWPLEIRVTRYPGSRWFQGTAELREPSGKPYRVHRLAGRFRCADVIAYLAMDISLDALILGGYLDAKPPPDPKPEATRAASAPCPDCPVSRFSIWPPELPLPPLRAPEPDPPRPAEKGPWFLRFGAGVWADYISSDRGSLGLTLDVSVRRGWFSIMAEGRGDPPIGSTAYTDHVSVRFARVTGALLLCGHIDPLVACLKGQVGPVLFPGTLPPQPAHLYTAAGVRIGLEFPVRPTRFILRLDGELLPTIAPASIEHAGQTVFQVAGWNAGLGVSGWFSVGGACGLCGLSGRRRLVRRGRGRCTSCTRRSTSDRWGWRGTGRP